MVFDSWFRTSRRRASRAVEKHKRVSMVFRASWNCEEKISEGVGMPQEPDPPVGVRKALRLRWKPPEERPVEGRNQRPPIEQRRCVAVCLWRAGRRPWIRFQTRLKTIRYKRLFTARLVHALGSRRVEEGRRSRRAEHAVPLPLQNRLPCAVPAYWNQPPRLPAFPCNGFLIQRIPTERHRS